MSLRVKDILSKAMRVIGTDRFQYRRFLGYNTSDIGTSLQHYGTWISIVGCIQPGIISSFGGKNIGERDYQEMGFDWSKSYITVWVHADIGTVKGQNGPDQILWKNKLYNIIQSADWIEQNGWRRLYCVEDINKFTLNDDEGGSSSSEGSASS